MSTTSYVLRLVDACEHSRSCIAACRMLVSEEQRTVKMQFEEKQRLEAQKRAREEKLAQKKVNDYSVVCGYRSQRCWWLTITALFVVNDHSVV